MIRYLIDTNVASEMRKTKPHGGVSNWLRGLALDQGFISAVTFGEIQRGIELTRQQDAQKAAELEAWNRELERTSNVLPMDAECFREWAILVRGKSDTLLVDAMIAATARVHGLTVATRDTADFAAFSVPVFNPFTHRS